MLTERERIRNAVCRALEHLGVPDSKDNLSEFSANAEGLLTTVKEGELPNHIVAKVPEFLDFLKKLGEAHGTGKKSELVRLVLDNRTLVYDNLDFTLYVQFIIERHQRLGEEGKAKLFSHLLNTVRMVGLVHG